MEKRLKIMLALALAGIFLLIIISNLLEPKPVDISKISSEMLDQKVSMIGNLAQIKIYNNETFFVLTIKDSTGNITITALSENKLKEKLILNQTYFITGKVQEYNRTLQISAEKIENIPEE